MMIPKGQCVIPPRDAAAQLIDLSAIVPHAGFAGLDERYFRADGPEDFKDDRCANDNRKEDGAEIGKFLRRHEGAELPQARIARLFPLEHSER